MTRILEFRPDARKDFDDAADRYESQRQGLRVDFVHAVNVTLANILNAPLFFPIVHGSNVRRALVRRFPYAMLFAVEENRILIYAVFHTSRNPIIWRGRVE